MLWYQTWDSTQSGRLVAAAVIFRRHPCQWWSKSRPEWIFRVSWCRSWMLTPVYWTDSSQYQSSVQRLQSSHQGRRKLKLGAMSLEREWRYRNPQLLVTEVPLRCFQLLLISSLLRLDSWASLSQTLEGKGKGVGGSCEVSISVCPRHLNPTLQDLEKFYTYSTTPAKQSMCCW